MQLFINVYLRRYHVKLSSVKRLYRQPKCFTCHPIQPSPIPLLRVVLFWSVLLLMLQNYKKKCIYVSSIGRFRFLMSMDMHINISYHPYGDGDSTWIWTASIESLLIALFPKTMVLKLLSVIIFTGRPLTLPPNFTGARGAHKRHQGYIYSHHRVQNSY